MPRIYLLIKFFSLLISCGATLAQEFPTRPLRVIVPYTPGGPDLFVRPVAQHLSEYLGKPVTIDYRTGGGGVPAILSLMNDPADGHTMMAVDTGIWGIQPAVRPSVQYDPLRDFAPIRGLFSTGGLFLVALPSARFKDMKELVAFGKANPGKLRYAVTGLGGIHHVAGVSFASAFGLDMLAINYKGSTDTMLAVIRGEVDFGYAGLAGVAAVGERVNLLAVVTRTRNKYAADVPTVMEAGGMKEDFHFQSQGGLVARAGTPRPTVEKLSAAMAKALSQPDVLATGQRVGYEVLPKNTAEFADLIREDLQKYVSLAKARGIKVE